MQFYFLNFNFLNKYFSMIFIKNLGPKWRKIWDELGFGQYKVNLIAYYTHLPLF
jgi:hypothetical protein